MSKKNEATKQKKWNKENIQELLDTRDDAVLRAVVVIHSFQTRDEQKVHTSIGSNKVGFNRFDAKVLSNYADMIHRKIPLTYQDIAFARHKMKKYWKQLADIANANEEVKEDAKISSSAIEDAIIRNHNGNIDSNNERDCTNCYYGFCGDCQ